jgi:hypothetical protein
MRDLFDRSKVRPTTGRSVSLQPAVIHRSTWKRYSRKFTAQAGTLAYSLVVLVALLYPLLLVEDRALCFWIYERLMVRSIGGTKALLGLICLNPTYSPALEPTPQHHWKAAVGFT